MWVVFFGGVARRCGASRPAWLAKANQLVYPCYVAHQVIIVAIAFYVVRLSLPLAIKYLLIAIPSALATLAVALMAARVPILGPCLGYWAKPRPATA
jgi:hypothetical protein